MSFERTAKSRPFFESGTMFLCPKEERGFRPGWSKLARGGMSSQASSRFASVLLSDLHRLTLRMDAMRVLDLKKRVQT